MFHRGSYNFAIGANLPDPEPQKSKSDQYAEKGYNGTEPPAYMGDVVTREKPDDIPERGTWDNKAEFILSCVGMSVGLGNVWRFPYLAYENGGAAFLIAYLILQLLIGKPMYFMELVMGQYSGKGPTRVWDMNPAAKGIGISMCVISIIAAIYYNIVIAYAIYFFFASMQSTLPWSECTEDWIRNFNCSNDDDNSTACVNGTCKSPAEIYFYEEVIQKSAGLEPDNIGTPLWKLTLCLLGAWVVVIGCLIKGIKSSGKVVYFTATFPYIILLILLVRGALLDGAIDGVEFFIIPKWDKLTDIDVWVAALGQMFFSLSVSFGGIIMFGSYNKFKNQVYYDSLFISIMDLVTSIVAGFVVFTTLGGLAKTLDTTVDKVAKSGYGLAFVVYPEALSNMPVPQLWSVLFFFMLFTLGLDSEFGIMETVLTCLQDEWPKLRKYKSYMAIGLGLSCFLLALPCACPGGDYVVTLMDHYGADFSVLILSCLEVISVMWVYGVMQFMRDIEYMLGSRPHGWPYWVFCWSMAPIFIAALVVYRMANYNAPKYDSGEKFPYWAQGVGWVLMTIALCPIPLWFIWKLFGAWRSGGDILAVFRPNKYWGPNDGSGNIFHQKHNSFPLAENNGAVNPAVARANYAHANPAYS